VSTLFEPIVSASDLESGLLEQLRKWMRDYLAEVERQHGMTVGTLPQPRSYVVSSELEKMPEDQTPAVIVRSPGTLEPPHADGGGSYFARFTIDAGVHLSARGNTHALRVARLYTSAIRAVLVQQQLLDELDARLLVRRVDWLGERYGELDSIDDRTVCTGVVVLAYTLDDVVTRGAGPLAPTQPPTPPDQEPPPVSPAWPTAATVDVDITKESRT
jgi:hypothetical protein